MTDDDKRDKIIRRRVRKLAEEHGVTVADVEHALDQHPVHREPGTFLKRTLALELTELDALQAIFHKKAIDERDPASAAISIKIHERLATLLGLNPPQGHAVQILSQPGSFRDRESSLAAFERSLIALGKPLPPPAAAGDDDTNGSAH